MPDATSPLEQRRTAAETAHLEPDVHAVLRAAERREIRPTRRNRDGAGRVDNDASRAGKADPAVACPDGAPALERTADCGDLAPTREDWARLHERVSTLCRLVEEGRSSAHQREAEAWRVREAELERRIAAERESGERRAAEARDEMRAEIERVHRAADQARQDADQARAQREQDRERHRGAELAWMNERRANLGRINQLELELERRRGFFARLLRCSS
ncbi:MAG TPA: hypothetical protein VGD08_04700 [Stellaceae bacterium]